MTPTERAACDKAYHKWYDTDDDGETSFDEAMFAAGLAYARAAELAQWSEATSSELELLAPAFSRLARLRGKWPDKVLVHREAGEVKMSAMQYLENGTERWGIQLHPEGDIRETWSTLAQWIHAAAGNRPIVEVYPTQEATVDRRPVRWFWIHELTGCDIRNPSSQAAELATLRQRIERLELELKLAHRTAAEIVGVVKQ